MRFIIISGQSGAGKSVALHALEDLGYYGIDNLPLRLLPALADELEADSTDGFERVAAVVDVRNPRRTLADFSQLLEAVEARGVTPRVLFLEADRDVLLKRFSETRRRHPLTSSERPLPEALDLEANLLEPVREQAGILIDTSRTHLHQLRAQVQERIGELSSSSLSILLQSFGFKHAAPRDADMVFDVRCLPNPYWKPELRALDGRDPAVRGYLEQSALVQEMEQSLEGFLRRWIPRFEAERRSYLSLAVGCTGGRHRSVYIVERLAARLRDAYPSLIVRHRELEE